MVEMYENVLSEHSYSFGGVKVHNSDHLFNINYQLFQKIIINKDFFYGFHYFYGNFKSQTKLKKVRKSQWSESFTV